MSSNTQACTRCEAVGACTSMLTHAWCASMHSELTFLQERFAFRKNAKEKEKIEHGNKGYVTGYTEDGHYDEIHAHHRHMQIVEHASHPKYSPAQQHELSTQSPVQASGGPSVFCAVVY